MLGNNNQNHWLKQLNLFLMDFNMVADQQPYVLSHIQLLPTPDRKTNYSEKKNTSSVNTVSTFAQNKYTAYLITVIIMVKIYWSNRIKWDRRKDALWLYKINEEKIKSRSRFF